MTEKNLSFVKEVDDMTLAIEDNHKIACFLVETLMEVSEKFRDQLSSEHLLIFDYVVGNLYMTLENGELQLKQLAEFVENNG